LTAKVGHNSDGAPKGAIAGEELKAFVERIEHLEEEKKALSEDLKELYGEIKGRGFETKIIRIIIRERKLERTAREERDALLDLYWSALGGIFA
jgi:uncharacterized protein (UPF0335 family)